MKSFPLPVSKQGYAYKRIAADQEMQDRWIMTTWKSPVWPGYLPQVSHTESLMAENRASETYIVDSSQDNAPCTTCRLAFDPSLDRIGCPQDGESSLSSITIP
jgi:hypothetical protein